MAFTPAEAFARCSAAQLSFKERKAHQDTIHLVDNFLSTKWEGHSCNIKTSAIPVKVMGQVIRSYVQAGWDVNVMAVDGKMAKAAEILARGGDCEFVITLTPRWRDLPATGEQPSLASIQ